VGDIDSPETTNGLMMNMRMGNTIMRIRKIAFPISRKNSDFGERTVSFCILFIVGASILKGGGTHSDVPIEE